MPRSALWLYLVYVLLAVGLRAGMQWRATGSFGFRLSMESSSPAKRFAGVLFLVATPLFGLLAPVLHMAHAVAPIPGLDSPVAYAIGFILLGVGLGGVLFSQFAMGTSWRIGVDESERTTLVTSGPFAVVRNPIFACMIPTAFGFALLVPNWVAWLGVACLMVALEVHVRLVEEPYLCRTHGEAYEAYAARTGRFLPGIGRSTCRRR